MPILFVTLSQTFAEQIRGHGFEAHVTKIQDYVPNRTRRTYYVSPANSLCFMDGGIDFALSRIVFPGVESKVKRAVRDINHCSILGRPYLPIGSSLIINEDEHRSLVVSPTMLLPQDVSTTRNAYYCTMAVLYNILVNRKEDLSTIDILLTSLCCGYGKMTETESIKQILDGIRDYRTYAPHVLNDSTIFKEPNLAEQPKYYQNTEFVTFPVEEIIRC